MKYAGMPMGMWTLFSGSFTNNLTEIFGIEKSDAKEIARKAKPKYKELISELPGFEKADRFKMNIVNCALLCAFIAAFTLAKSGLTVSSSTENFSCRPLLL